MSKNRITGTKIDWTELTSRVPTNQKANMIAFKTRYDHHLKTMRTIPVKPPKIHWDYYKSHIGPKYIKWLEEFQTKYNSLKIPYPIDNYTEKINENLIKIKEEIKEYQEKSNENIKIIKCEIERIKKIMPYDQMTQEDFIEAHPELAHDFINKPTFWPHNPEEQTDYVPPTHKIDNNQKK